MLLENSNQSNFSSKVGNLVEQFKDLLKSEQTSLDNEIKQFKEQK
jgi:Sec-independent protein translocase protein TatA